MKPSRFERNAPLLIAILTSVLVLAATRSELDIAREPLNDLALHIPLAERLSDAFRSGENPLDCWVSEWTLGHPVPRTYQPLGPLAVASVHAALGGRIALLDVFVAFHWLLIGLLPLCLFAGARRMGLQPGTCAAAAVLSPLLSTDLLFGLELGSTCWRGSGLFTQSWAQGLLPLSLGLGVQRLRRGGSLVAPAVLLALTFSAHFVYGLIGALSLALAAALPRADADEILAAPRRALRLLGLGALTFALSAWLLVPLALDKPWINHSRWEAAWKWDSLGLPKVARLLATGDLLDFGRFPAVTLLALLGLSVVATRLVLRRASDAERFVLAGAALWLVLYCGTPAWDGLYQLMGMGDVPLHRLIGGTHLFLLLLAAIGAAFLAWLPTHVFAQVELRHARLLSAALGLLVAVLALAPAIAERLAWLKTGEAWGRETIALTNAERGDLDAAVALCKQRGGRAWSGSAGGWGKDFGVKWTPFHAFLSRERVPQVSFLYHAMALTSDIMVRFDEHDPAHWRLFGVRTGVAPPDREFGGFTTRLEAFGRFHVYAAPGGGMFDVVDVVGSRRCDRRSFYDVVDPWLASDAPGQRRHLALDLEGRFPEDGMPSRPVDERIPEAAATAPEPGRMLSEERSGERYGARVEIDAEHAWVMLKMTWHPAWVARVNGERAPTSHITPGFVAVRVPRGTHDVALAYEPGSLKIVLLMLAPLAALAAWLLRRNASRVEGSLAPRLSALASGLARSPRVREAAGVAVLALLAGMPLLLPGLGTGHDAVAYPPRVVEMHESLRHGILLPRWAADLSAGHGQPFFLFTPPLPGWLAAPIFAATGDVSRALGLSAFAVLLLGILAMRRAARVIASERASWVAATAFALAPYVLTDLHVRAAYAESVALLLAPVALLGLLSHAAQRRPRDLALAAAGVALVGLSHHASALMVVPLMLALALVHGITARSPRLALQQAAAIALGVLVAACAWMPGLLESGLVKLDSAREGYFHWSEHLVEPWQLAWSRWGFGLSERGSGDGMSFRLGLPHLALAMVAGACAVDASRRRKTVSRGTIDAPPLILTAALLAGVLLLSLLMTPLGAFAWRVLPLLPSLQFPWRLSGAVTLLLALLAALAADGLSGRLPAWLGRFVAPLLIGALIVTGYPLARPADRTHPNPAALTPDELSQRAAIVTSIEEMEPREVETRAAWSPDLVSRSEGAVTARAERLTPERWRLVVADEGIITLRLHDFEGWTVVGEDITKLAPDVPTGRMRLQAGVGGERVVALRLQRSGVQLAGLWMSLAGAVGVLALALRRSPLLARDDTRSAAPHASA